MKASRSSKRVSITNNPTKQSQRWIVSIGLTIGIGALCFAYARGGLPPHLPPLVATSVSAFSMKTQLPDDHSEESLANRKLKFALIQARLLPENLAAAHISSNATTALVNSARSWFIENSSALETATSAVRTAKLALAPLDKLRERGLASSEQLSQLATAREALATAESALSLQMQNLRAAATADLSQQQQSDLALLDERVSFPCPLELRLGERTESDAVALRDIAANRRISDRIGSDFVGEEGAATFSESDATIVGQYEELLPSVRQAWLNAIGSIE